jgi:predicted DNA-binding transcriptional regulator AlpA
MVTKEPRPDPRWTRNAALARYLGVTTMTIWRHQRNPNLNFPQPVSINGVQFTDLNLVDDWMRTRVICLNQKVAAR